MYFMIIKCMLGLTTTDKYNCDVKLFPVDNQGEGNINRGGIRTIEVAVIPIDRQFGCECNSGRVKTTRVL